MKKPLLAIVFLLIPINLMANGEISQMMPAKHIVHLSRVLAKLREQSKIPVLFPKYIPKHAKTLYASSHYDSNNGYVISISTQENCGGIKVCTVGSVSAKQWASPEILYNRDHKRLTMSVMLKHNNTGFYTPGHAMADYWPAMITWRQQKVLYKIVWELDKGQQNTKEMLIEMANSAQET